jgi:hypothetical protein
MSIGISSLGFSPTVADMVGVGVISVVGICLSSLIEKGIDILFPRAGLSYDLSKYGRRNKNKFQCGN